MKGVDKMEETYSIKELIDLMLAKLWLIIVLTIVGGGAAFGYAKIMMPLKYSSFSTMYVKNNKVSSSESVNLNDLNASKSLVSTYATVLRSSTVMNEVSDTLLHECGIVCTPGSGFGSCGNGYVRFSAFSSRENTEKAMEKLVKFLK